MKKSPLPILLGTALAGTFAARAADSFTPAVLVRFDGVLAGTTYTPAVGEIDTTGTFQASGTPTIDAGLASLAGGTTADGFDFNPGALGSLTAQNWVAEVILSFDAFETGQRTMIDVMGDLDFRVNNGATNLEALYWDGSTTNPVLTTPLPAPGALVHYALVWDAAATSLTAYVNGVSIGTSDHAAFATPDTTNVSFGYLGRSGFDGRSIDGTLDAVGFATYTGSFDPAADFQLYTPVIYSYWDTDGATPGAGGTFPDGNWGDANWSAAAAGNQATSTWVDGSNAAFSAGGDATGFFEVDLGGVTRQVGDLLVEEGDLVLDNGNLEILNDGSIATGPGALLSISSGLTASDLTISGDVLLGGATTITGGLTVSSGTLLLDVPLSVAELSGAGTIGFSGNAFAAGGTDDSTFAGVLSGTAVLTKQGAGTLGLTNLANNFSGGLVVSAGTLATGPNAGDGITGYLGSVEGARTITIQPGATVRLTQANVFGGGGKTAATIPSYQIDGGTLRTGRFNIIGDVTLGNGATLDNASTETNPNYGGFQMLGEVTSSGGTTPCQISDDGSSRPVHLLGAGTTIFQVEDLTASGDADLVVSSDLADGSGDYPGVGSLAKTGAGTLSLTGANTYTGTTTVSSGTLAVNGSSLPDTGILVIDGGVVEPTGTETVDTLFFGAAQQAAGTWGATGSSAQHIDDTRFAGTGVIEVTTGAGLDYTTWATANAGGDAAEVDSDGDGVPNGVEFLMGETGSSFTTNPTLVNGTITWPKDPTALASWVVETSTTLQDEIVPGDGGWAPAAGVIDNGGSIEFTPPASGTRLFIRLRVNVAP
ncbi:MAG: autotransporter-associated beta strand repeat-containing protein [Verrucomicrobiae bacterium]|nr:autotransporter-associated beta strand repeat-containing protein [Verrucomicrobiae bacterium]